MTKENAQLHILSCARGITITESKKLAMELADIMGIDLDGVCYYAEILISWYYRPNTHVWSYLKTKSDFGF